MISYLNENSRIGYMLIPGGETTAILTLSIKPPARAKEFLRKWAHHLINSPVPKQWLAAYALATTNGDPIFDEYRISHARRLLKLYPKKYCKGPTTHTFRQVGLFGIWLPHARTALKNTELTAKELLNTELQFKMISDAFDQEQTIHSKNNDPVKLALAVHGSTLQYDRAEPYHIDYRGTFLPDFIAWYNTVHQIILAKENKK